MIRPAAVAGLTIASRNSCRFIGPTSTVAPCRASVRAGCSAQRPAEHRGEGPPPQQPGHLTGLTRHAATYTPADPALASRPIHAVAARWGFTNNAHFSGLFRATYDTSPVDYHHHTHHGAWQKPATTGRKTAMTP
ncbi:hypothetical protein [Streptosporangium sp. NPDC051022]|uniref:hypothetical protein n=1 Tax=Streptosporangium sp. NPDC051022 TaxID=3155752 RepID=UPI00342BB062